MSQPPIVITTHTTIRGILGVLGPAAPLRAAFEDGTPVTLDGKCAGQQIYLGHRRQTYDDGVQIAVQGLDAERAPHADYPDTPRAVYLIDMNRLDGAPAIKALRDQAHAASLRAAAETEKRAAAADRRVRANTYDHH